MVQPWDASERRSDSGPTRIRNFRASLPYGRSSRFIVQEDGDEGEQEEEDDIEESDKHGLNY